MLISKLFLYGEKEQIQPLLSSMCDQLSLLVVYLLKKGFKYEEIVKSLTSFYALKK